jgi:lysozyme
MTKDFGLTPELVALVKKEEGWVDHPYICPAGYPTIGWGHRIDSMDHPSITPLEGERLLWADLRFHRDAALRLSPNLANEPERRLAAITDFCYNLGPTAYAKSGLRVNVNAGKWKLAGVQMRRWVHARDPKTGKMRRLAGLVSRREIAARWLEES